MKKSLFVLMFLPLLVYAGSDVYRCKDEAGKTYYSDKECEGGKKMVLPSPQTYTPQPSQRRFNYTPPKKTSNQATYDTVEITLPINDSTIRDNSGNVAVSVSTSPALRTGLGHKLQLYVDGQPFGEAGSSADFNLSNLDRGTHTLKPVVVDHSGKVVAEGKSSTFHVHRISTLLKKKK